MLCIPCLIVMFSCGDDNGDCVQADYIGTWTGTESCTPLGTENNVTITVIEKGNALEIDGGEFVTDEVGIDGCSVSRDATTFGTGFKYSGSLSDDGGTLTLTHTQELVGEVVNQCTYTLTK